MKREKRDEGMMGREEERRIICATEIFPAAAVMKHTDTCAAVNQRPFLTRHPRL